MTIFLGLSSVGLILGILITWWLHNQYHLEIVVTPAPALSAAPFVSVVVPARNEARNIRRCVASLLAQDYPAFEVIVVDDRSTDATPRILAALQATDPRLTILPGVDLPPGWAGKPHALHQGVHAAGSVGATHGGWAAHGEWLCFVDADTFLAPGCLSATQQAAEAHHADLFTLMTRQELGSFWEKTILPLVFLALSVGFSPRRVNDLAKPDAVANGQFIFIRREAYEAVGGYAAIRDRIVEDKALAELIKRSGRRLVVADGSALVSTRMYTSLPELWEGWTKNIYLGLQDRVWLLLIGAFTGLLGALFLPFWLLSGLGLWLVLGGWVAGLILLEAALLWAWLLFWRVRACRAFEISPVYALTLPLGALVFTAMMFASAFRVLSGRGVTWRGRTYQP